MATTARDLDAAPAREPSHGRFDGPRRKAKIAAVLVTADDGLWPQVGKFVPSQFSLKQADSLEQFLKDTAADAAAVLIWDARGQDNAIERLTQLQQHSARFVVLALDAAPNSSGWDSLVRTNQIVALVTTPIFEGEFVKSLNKAGDELLARSALLGEPAAGLPAAGRTSQQAAGGPRIPAARRRPWLIGAALAAALAAAGLTWHRGASIDVAPAPAIDGGSAPAAPSAAAPAASVADQIEDLLEKAGQAMLDRRYVAPADNNALAFYRRVLAFDAQNGEARQGLERMAELLLSRAQSALDSHQYEAALQSLEIARNLKPDDPRAKALDVRLGNMRAELGAAQIQAALNAQNFERAGLLIDEALKVRGLTAVQAAQLRETLKRQRAEFDVGHYIKLAQARLQQDRLIEPEGDSAAYYLERARHAGASSAELASDSRALLLRVIESARAAIEQRRVADADRWIAEARSEGAGAATLSTLQRDLVSARASDGRDKNEPARGADAARAAARATPVEAEADKLPIESVSKVQPADTAPEAALVLLRPIRPVYPQAAALKGQEGWVELAFTVNANGAISNTKVIDASPAGVFDQAAVKALQAAAYQPLSTTDLAISRQATLKLKFRLSK